MRAHALEIFRAGIAAVDGRARTRDALRAHDDGAVWHLIAVGKAAAAMTLGAYDALGERVIRGLVVGKKGIPSGELLALPLRVLEAGHPLPDEASLRAGAEVQAFMAAAPGHARFLCLISGGASSLVERLPAGMDLAALVDLNRWLLASGLDIVGMNRVRQAVSCLKGGRLAVALGGRRCRALLMSDVSGDDPAVIGSGLLSPGRHDNSPPALPEALRPRLQFAPPPPATGDPVFAGVSFEIVARLEEALEAAGAAAIALGYPTRIERERVSGDASAAGERIARALVAGAPGATIRGGETTVRLPVRAGRGGRCQQLALAAAVTLEGEGDCVLLAAGTDGFDGPGEDAGALVDGQTLARGRRHGFNANDCLRCADSGAFLEAAGDLLSTGPTVTNVADLIVGIRN
ncbi:MAG: DUF4147 domain-containing protein [Gammaproteobacteria bacterium]|nr:DUF4147 domain-containing protein [Gammaproteobacteria bacterium]